MKINPILSYGSSYCFKKGNATSGKSLVNQAVMDKNLSQVNYENYFNINFKATHNANKSIAHIIKTAPLEDKFAVALNKLDTNCLLLVGKSKQEIFKNLKNDSKNVVGFLRKLYILTDPNINEFFAVSKDNFEYIYVQNLHKNPLLFSTLEHQHDGILEYLKINDQAILTPGDMVSFGDNWISIKDSDISGEELWELDKRSNMFIQEYDFTDDIERFVAIHNSKVLDVLGKGNSKTEALSFSDVGGQDEIIDKLKKFVLFPMKYPQAFKGYMVNRGVVLYGPPGTGKSLIAEALTNEANASCFKLSGSELESKWVGESEKNCRELFSKAIDAQPSIIYIDEFDALGKERSGKDVHGDKLLNQLLASMSQIEKSGDNVFIIAATNKLDTLDPAIIRSGRFGQQYEVKLPDIKGTEQIFRIHMEGKPISKSLDINAIAKIAYDKKMSGADIAALINSAYVHALERTGIYESMDNGRFSNEMLNYFEIIEDDFRALLDEIKPNQQVKIGF